MNIGDKVWKFDGNRRVYTDPEGNKLLSPWYRGHFVERYIVGETSRSWIVGFIDSKPDSRVCFKVPKNNPGSELYLSEEEIDKLCWVHDNHYKISQEVLRCNDYDKLQQINRILHREKRVNP